MYKFVKQKAKEQYANAMVENVIILPLIFIIIYAIIVAAFIIHDRSTLEAAARRGAIYGSHCVNDPNYSVILSDSGNESGSLDTSIEQNSSFNFTNLGRNVHPYRFIFSNQDDLETAVEAETYNIIEESRLPWKEIEIGDIDCNVENNFLYQDVVVSVNASYPLPELFGAFGLPTDYEYTVSAKMTVNDPDEFLRNVDLVVDIFEAIDDATGNHIENAAKKISQLVSKLTDFLQ